MNRGLYIFRTTRQDPPDGVLEQSFTRGSLQGGLADGSPQPFELLPLLALDVLPRVIEVSGDVICDVRGVPSASYLAT